MVNARLAPRVRWRPSGGEGSKRHGDVIRAVRELIENAAELAERNFAFCSYDDRGRQSPRVEMDRDGFSLLAMGFTGEKALRWKLKYIQAFNGMETELRSRAAPESDEEVLSRAFLIA